MDAIACLAETFSSVSLLGGEILAISAALVLNYTINNGYQALFQNENITGLNFCNVSVTYTHPGQNDNINVNVWLPPADDWNGRFMAVAGGGWTAGYFDGSLSGAAVRGYSTASTDAGGNRDETSPKAWALRSPENVDWNMIQNFGSIALNDLAILGKAVTQSFYDTAPKYSYFNGCSGGGRQGFMMAQRYPTQYDGILAAAPAINWPSVIASLQWAQAVMNNLNQYPRPCEFTALTAAAIQACDSNDGVTDSIIARPDLCNFDAQVMVGKNISCEGTPFTISQDAALVANAAWAGPKKPDGSFLWYGVSHNAPLTTGVTGTSCSANGTCVGVPYYDIGSSWIQYYFYKDPGVNLTSMTLKQYADAFFFLKQEYESILGTSDPDLSHFREAGGKLLSWHGLADEALPARGTADYYNQVASLDPALNDYFRFFEVPGVEHCGGGTGAFPYRVVESLTAWVENGTVPTVLEGRSEPVNGTARYQNLCLYPLVSQYIYGDVSLASSYECVPRRLATGNAQGINA